MLRSSKGAASAGIAIVDGSSAPSDHENGIWAMDEIDDLLEIEGAAETMAELRRRFGAKIRAQLSAEARRLVDAETGRPARMRLSCTEATMPTDASLREKATPSEDSDGTTLSWLASRGADISDGRIRNHFRSAAPHMPRTIRVGFAKARLGT